MFITPSDIIAFIVGSCKVCMYIFSVALFLTWDWNLAWKATFGCYGFLLVNRIWDEYKSTYRFLVYYWYLDTKDDALVTIKILHLKAIDAKEHITTAITSLISSITETASHIKIILVDTTSIVRSNALEFAVTIQPSASRTITTIEHYVPQYTSLTVNSMHAGTKVSSWSQNDPLEDYYYERAVNTLTFLFERMSLDDGINYFEQLPSSTFGDPIRGLPMWIAYRTSVLRGAGQRAAHSWSRVSHRSINPYSNKCQKAQTPKGLIQGNQTSSTFFQPALEGSFATNGPSATPALPKRSQEPSRNELDNKISSSEASISLSLDGNNKASKSSALMTADLLATDAASGLSISPGRKPDATAAKTPDATRTTSRAGLKKKKTRKTTSKLSNDDISAPTSTTEATSAVCGSSTKTVVAQVAAPVPQGAVLIPEPQKASSPISPEKSYAPHGSGSKAATHSQSKVPRQASNKSSRNKSQKASRPKGPTKPHLDDRISTSSMTESSTEMYSPEAPLNMGAQSSSGQEMVTPGALALSEALKTNSTLTTLDLWRNSIGDKGAQALYEVSQAS
ncbi:hypothetical protein BG000_011345 [Podila horticola]|nr:hypothetical protein BG000_011345 [Podila horticola]